MEQAQRFHQMSVALVEPLRLFHPTGTDSYNFKASGLTPVDPAVTPEEDVDYVAPGAWR